MSQQVSPLDLPSDPSPDQLEVIEKYLRLQKKMSGSGYGTKNTYQDRHEILGKKLIIFKHPQKKKDVWYMRFYVGNKKYKQLSLRTSDKSLAIEKALDKWRSLQGHIELGGEVFEQDIDRTIEEYLSHLKDLVETGQMKRLTMTCKNTSLKKLGTYLKERDNQKPSSISPDVLSDYVKWRRTKNWDKKKHVNNPDPPTDLTINKEMSDFKGYFDWMKKKRRIIHEIEYPFLKIDWKKSVEKNPSFEVDDWMQMVYYMRTWVRKTEGRKEYGIFYRKVFCEYLKVLGNSGLRVHECLMLKWTDVQIKKKEEVSYRPTNKKKSHSSDESSDDVSGKKSVRERLIAHIQVSPDTKTGRRLVICPAGVYFRRIRDLYRDKTGSFPKPNDYIFMNIGTSHSKKMDFVGKHLSSDHMRKLWYEFMEDLKTDRDIHFTNHYTMYSCRAFFINQRLEMGVPPNYVAKLVGHSIKTMERHYENIQLKNLEPELVEVRKKKLEEADFQTYDLELD